MIGIIGKTQGVKIGREAEPERDEQETAEASGDPRDAASRASARTLADGGFARRRNTWSIRRGA